MIRPSALLPHACLPTAGSQIYGSQRLGDTLVAINAKKRGRGRGTSLVTACTRRPLQISSKRTSNFKAAHTPHTSSYSAMAWYKAPSETTPLVPRDFHMTARPALREDSCAPPVPARTVRQDCLSLSLVPRTQVKKAEAEKHDRMVMNAGFAIQVGVVQRGPGHARLPTDFDGFGSATSEHRARMNHAFLDNAKAAKRQRTSATTDRSGTPASSAPAMSSPSSAPVVRAAVLSREELCAARLARFDRS